MENWKYIKNYEGLYQISDMGRVKRVKSKVNSGLLNSGYRITKETILKPHIKRNGYLSVDLSKNNIVKTMSIHRLVALAFCENDNPEIKKVVDHINCNKQDNRAINLEWVSDRENKDRAMANNLYNNPKKRKVRCKQLNIVFDGSYEAGQYINNKYFQNSKQVSSLANKIRACCNGKQKTASGFTWEYM